MTGWLLDTNILSQLRRPRPKWRLLVEDGGKASHTFSQPDLIMAATALHHGLTVVSRDASQYQKARRWA